MIAKKRTMTFLLMFVILFTISACSASENTSDSNELVIYSSRNERFVQPLLDQFEKETSIRVRALHGVNPLQIVEEAQNVRADIIISNDLGVLGYLHENGYLQGSEPVGIEKIPAMYRADDNAYFALSSRARGFIYNKDLIRYEDMPKSLEDLFDEKWKGVPNGYAVTNGSNGGMIGNVSALRFTWGDQKTLDWMIALSTHAAGIYQGHSDIRRAVGAGEHAFGLVNNYYFHLQLLEPTNNHVGFIYLDQLEDQMGVIINAAGVGLVKDGPNHKNGLAFLEWLLLDENQARFVGESMELPILSDTPVNYPSRVKPHIVTLDSLKIQPMPIKALGQYFHDTKSLIEQARFDLVLR